MMPHLQETVIVQPQIMEQKCLARALYDNIAESPDELAFRRGEVLVVLEQNPVGLQGWWLCALRGRQGICPGNRLRLVPGVYADTGQGLTNNVGESLDQTTDITMLQQHGKRRSWHVQPNKVVTPKKHVDVYLYDLPPSSTTPTPTSSRCSSSQNYSVPSQRYPSDICGQNNTNIIQNTNHDNNATLEANLAAYDVPPRAVPINYDVPRNWRNSPAPSVPQSPLPTNSPCPTTNYSYPSLPPHRSAHSPLPPVPSYLDHTQQSRYSPNSNQSSHPCPTNGDDISRSSSRRDSIDSSSYDVPRPLLFSQHLISPSSSASSLTTGDSFSSSNRSSLANMPDYDVPKPSLSLSQSGLLNTNSTNQNGTQNGSQGSNGQNQQELQQSVYDVPGTTPHSITPVVTPTSNLSHSPHPQEGRGLPLELSSALETLARLDSEASGAVGRLLALAGGGARWRVRAHLEPRLLDIRLAATRLGAATHDLAEFADGTLGNAAQAPDKGLAAKLRPLVKALKDADCLIQKATNTLDSQQWSIDVLSKPEVDEKESICKPPDALDQLIACSRSLTEDVRQIASFIQGNSTLLFKRTSPNNNNENGDWLEDYDYVSLESREAVAKEHAEIREQLPNKLKKGYDALLKNAEIAATEKNETQNMDPNDKQLLTFYAAQCITHSNHLTHAIDAFLQTVEHNQPPKVFLAHGKFVVLSAHRLVHIGDTVHRNITKNDIKTNALNCANALSEALAASVTKTKRAALQFPSVTAVQEMVDSVVDISHLAKDLKMCLVEAAQQP